MAALLSLGGSAVNVQAVGSGAAASAGQPARYYYSATKNETGWRNGLVLTKDAVRQGCARFSFVLVRGRSTTFGVCHPMIKWDSFLNETEHGWGLFALTGCIGHKGAAETPYFRVGRINEGDEIAVEVNADVGTLEYFVNGRSVGIAFRDMPTGQAYHGAFSLYKAGDIVEYRGMTRLEGVLSKPPLEKIASLGQATFGHILESSSASISAEIDAHAATCAFTPRHNANANAPPVHNGFWKACCGSDLVLSGPDRVVAHCEAAKPSWSCRTALAARGVSCGTAVWYFEILSATSTHITVGVMPAAQALSNPDGDFLNSAAQGGWGFYQRSGCVGHGGPAATAYHRPGFSAGDIVSVHLDRAKGELSFGVNGLDLGVAFRGIPRVTATGELLVLHGAVSLRDPGDRVRLLAVEVSDDRDADAAAPSESTDVVAATAAAAAAAASRGPFESASAPSSSSATTTTTTRPLPTSHPPPRPVHAAPAVPTSAQPTPVPGAVVVVWRNPSVVCIPNIDPSVESLRFQKVVPRGQRPSWGEGLVMFRPLLQSLEPQAAARPSSNADEPLTPGGSGFDDDGDWQPGVQRWTFKVHAGEHASFGVVTAQVDKHTFVNETKNGWAMFQRDGKVGHGGPAQRVYLGRGIAPGSTVTVEADRRARTLSFIVDGHNAGVAFSNLPDRTEILYGAVSLRDHLSEVELVPPTALAATAADAKLAQFKLTQFLRELYNSCREYDNLSLSMLKKCRFEDLYVRKKIGGGCSAEVYEVHCRTDSARRCFAMKKLYDLAGASEAEAIKHQKNKFLRDFRVPVSLRSSDEALSHIVQCYTHLVAKTIHPTPMETELGRGKTEYIIMECCKQSLQDYLDEYHKTHGTSPPEPVLLLCVLQILHALAVLEERRIIHRDLKLDNIMVKSGSDLELRLIDFGRGDEFGGNSLNMAPEVLKMAAEREAAENLMANDKKSAKRRGGGRGLFGLSAQAAAAAAARKNDELLDDATRQARFNAVCKADIWALGCLLYDLVRQKHPFPNGLWQKVDGPSEVSSQPFSPRPRPPLLPDVYPRLEELAGLFLRPNPEERPSARQATRIVGNLLWFPGAAPLPSEAGRFTATPSSPLGLEGTRLAARGVASVAAATPDLALVRAVRWEANKFVAQLEARGQFQVVYVRCIADKLKAQHLVDMLRIFQNVEDDSAE